jgi:hypothetical protein
VSARWLASEVASGHLRWILADSTGGGGRLPGDTRTGSQAAFSIVQRACRSVSLTGGGTLYDCAGRSAAILSAAGGAG